MNHKRFVLLVFLILLSACQPAAPGPAPVPLTGANASVLGASALLIQGKAGARTFFLKPILADTGQPTPGFNAIELGSNIQYGFSPDRELLAVVSFGAANCPRYCLHRIDLRAWKEILPPVELAQKQDVWAAEIAFDAQASRAAVALNDNAGASSQLVIVDLTSGKITAQAGWAPDSPQPRFQLQRLSGVRFTPSGYLALFGATSLDGHAEQLHVSLLDAARLETAWQQPLDEVTYGSEPVEQGQDPLLGRYMNPGTAFAPDGSRLYLVAADKQELVTVDFERRSVASAPIRPPQSLLDRLMASLAGVAHAKVLNGTTKSALISPDGARLYVVGQTTVASRLDNGEYTSEVTPLGLQVIDPASGTQLAKLDTEAFYLTPTPDGSALFLYSWPATNGPVSQPVSEVFDPAALKITGRLPGEIHATRLLNGELAWVSSQTLSETSARLSIFAPGSRAPRSQWTVEGSGYVDWVIVP